MKINEQDCMACLMCVEVCPCEAIQVREGAGSYKGVYIDEALCSNCGSCLEEVDCPGNAIGEEL